MERGLILFIYKEFLQINKKKTNDPLQQWTKILFNCS